MVIRPGATALTKDDNGCRKQGRNTRLDAMGRIRCSLVRQQRTGARNGRSLHPGIGALRIDADEAVDQSLHGPEEAIEERWSFVLRVEHADEVDAEGLRDRNQSDDDQCQLQPAGGVHGQNLSGRISE